MDGQNDSVLSWDSNKVHNWLSSLGFSEYESQIKEQGISGDILVHLDHSALKDLGVHSVGHRVAIMKAVYFLKIQHNVPVEHRDYTPPSAAYDSAMNDVNGILDLQKIENAFQERGMYFHYQVQRLSSELTKLREELIPIWKMVKEKQPLPEPERNISVNGSNLSVQVPSINVRPAAYSECSSAPPSPHSPRDVNNNRNNRYYDHD
ncbi:11661_t:CDS:2, partial [Acaulospora morrowiae]